MQIVEKHHLKEWQEQRKKRKRRKIRQIPVFPFLTFHSTFLVLVFFISLNHVYCFQSTEQKYQQQQYPLEVNCPEFSSIIFPTPAYFKTEEPGPGKWSEKPKPQCTLSTTVPVGAGSSGKGRDDSKETLKCERIRAGGNEGSGLGAGFRLVGEFGVLTINCSAPFLLDLTHDGFQPTEAVSLRYWKNISLVNPTPNVNSSQNFRNESGRNDEENLQFNSYGLTIQIWSIRALFHMYKQSIAQGKSTEEDTETGNENETPIEMNEQMSNSKRQTSFINRNVQEPIAYSRTGRFTIRGMWKDHHHEHFDQTQTFYFFLEEPLLENKFTWMKTELTAVPTIKIHKFNKTGTENIQPQFEIQIQIPCRPSHYKIQMDQISLIMEQKNESRHPFFPISAENFTFNPTFGFTSKFQLESQNGSELDKLEISRKIMEDFKIECQFRRDDGVVLSWKPDETDYSQSDWPLVGADTSYLKLKRADKTTVLSYSLQIPPNSNSNLNQRPNSKSKSSTSTALNKTSTKMKPRKKWQIFAWLKCQLDKPIDSNSYFVTVGANSPAEIQFMRHFILRENWNQSYFIQRAPQTRGVDMIVERERASGFYMCTDGQYYHMLQYGSSLDQQTWKVPPIFDWVETPPYETVEHKLDIQIHLMTTPKQQKQGQLYAQDDITFVCRFTDFVALPIMWLIHRKNGSRELVHIDTTSRDFASWLTLKLENDTQNISCQATFFQSTLWRKAHTTSRTFALKQGEEPKFNTSKTDNVHRVTGDSLGQIMRCEAEGDPKPDIWWERNGEVIGHGETYELPQITSKVLGEYSCIAKNLYGEVRRNFEVKLMSFSSSTIIAIVAVAAILFIAVICLLILYSRAQKKRQILTPEEIKEFREGIPVSDEDPRKSGNDYSAPLALAYPSDYEIPPSEFTIDDKMVLGSGAFGIVKKGIVRQSPAAVKMVKPGAEKAFVKSLLSELKILIYLGNHPSLVQLLGASTAQLTSGNVYVFVEFCGLGSLLSYIQDHRSEFLCRLAVGKATALSLESGLSLELIHKWAYEIAQGMSFLSQKRVIHGDIAARNILLSAGSRSAKITDFGLSRQLMHYSNYTKQSQEPLPFRWCAPESLTSLEFSCQSDVWMYGVLLWEMYSLGQVPFPGFMWNDEFISQLHAGHRLSCPQLISQELYSSLLLGCWAIEPEQRPSFEHIESILEPFVLNQPESSDTSQELNLYENGGLNYVQVYHSDPH